MRNRPLLIAGVVLALGLVASQAPRLFHRPPEVSVAMAQKAAALMQSASPGFLTPEEVHALAQAGVPVRFGDVRKAASYERKHIQGALSLPHKELATWGPKLTKDELVVLYCT